MAAGQTPDARLAAGGAGDGGGKGDSATVHSATLLLRFPLRFPAMDGATLRFGGVKPPTVALHPPPPILCDGSATLPLRFAILLVVIWSCCDTPDLRSEQPSIAADLAPRCLASVASTTWRLERKSCGNLEHYPAPRAMCGPLNEVDHRSIGLCVLPQFFRRVDLPVPLDREVTRKVHHVGLRFSLTRTPRAWRRHSGWR